MASDGFVHPSMRIKSTYSNLLEGKRIGLGITASVAAFLSPEIARKLIRHGAEVIPIMTETSLTMIGKDLMWWATGVEPIIQVTGDLEHISLSGVMNQPLDLMIIAPCTTNTLAKISVGIADTSVTLITSSLSGKGIPILILTVAHEDLINSPPIQKAISVLRESGVKFIEPIYDEGKAKVPDIDDIIFEIFEMLREKDMDNTSVIVTGGPTRSYLDNVRYITNSSSGKTGIELAKNAHIRGAKTNLVLGPTKIGVPRKINTTRISTSQEMVNEVMQLLEAEPQSMVILSAAMADFKVKEKVEGKIKSGNDLTLELQSTIKLSDMIKEKYPKSKLVLFKAEWNVSRDELIESAKNKLAHCNADFIVANDLSEEDAGFETNTNRVIVIDKAGSITELFSSKLELSEELFNIFSS